jgi:hypothetical protein
LTIKNEASSPCVFQYLCHFKKIRLDSVGVYDSLADVVVVFDDNCFFELTAAFFALHLVDSSNSASRGRRHSYFARQQAPHQNRLSLYYIPRSTLFYHHPAQETAVSVLLGGIKEKSTKATTTTTIAPVVHVPADLDWSTRHAVDRCTTNATVFFFCDDRQNASQVVRARFAAYAAMV